MDDRQDLGDGRSGVLRTEPIFVVSALRAPAAIAGGCVMTERAAIVAFIRKSAATLLTADMAQLTDAEDRREVETAARAIEVIADQIESGLHA